MRTTKGETTMGKLRTIGLDGMLVNAEYLGKGLFSTAYRFGDTVILLTDGDSSKEAISLFADQSLKHMPQIKRHEDWKQYQVFTMPYYRPLTKKEFPKAYATWKLLPSLLSKGEHILAWIDNEENGLPVELAEAMRELANCFANYNWDTMFMEFNKANVSVDQNGELVLRDCLGSDESVSKKRNRKRNRSRHLDTTLF
jgi:hypothetical protein